MILAWLIVIPFVGGVLAALAARTGRTAPRWICLAALAAELALAVAVWTGGIGNHGQTWMLSLDAPWIPAVGARFILAMDGLSLLMVLLTAVLGMTAVLCGMGVPPMCSTGVSPVSESEQQQQDRAGTALERMGKMPMPRAGLYHFFMMWMLAGITGIFLAMDLLLFFFFWEMMIIPLYFLIGIWGGPGRAAAATKIFIFTQVSGLLLLIASLGLMFAHGRPYTLSYFDLLGTALPPGAGMLLMLGFFVAFAVKLPAFGAHTWLVDAHEQAPVSGGVDLSGLVVKVGAYGLLRFVVPLFPHAAMEFATFARVLAVAGILYGGIMAFAQTDLKRLAAYSSVSHMGFVLLGVFTWNELALQGVVILIISSGIGAGALFVVIGAIHARTGRRDLDRMGGLWQMAPRLGGVGLFFALAAMGLPGLASFVGEVLVLLGAFQVSVTFAAIAAGGMLVSVIYALWMVQKVFQGPLATLMEETDVVERDLGAREWIMLAPAIVIMLWLGLHPGSALVTSAPAVRNLMQLSEGQGEGELATASNTIDVRTCGDVGRSACQGQSLLFGVPALAQRANKQTASHVQPQPMLNGPEQTETTRHGQDARVTHGQDAHATTTGGAP